MPAHTLKITLPLALASATAHADEPVVFLAGGYTYTAVGGSSPGHGHGFELTLPFFPDDGGVVGIAPLLQARWLDNGEPASWTVGGEIIGPLFGMEFGHSTRHYGGVERAGIHLGPFLSFFGVLNLSGRFVVPVDDGAGEYGAMLSVKAPLPIIGNFSLGMGAPHGRPLRVAGQVVHVPVWLGARCAQAPGLSDADRRQLAGAWIEDAKMEHASVAAFELIAEQLRGHGAPVALVREAERAAVDEADHAHRCLTLASALLGRRVHIGPVDGAALRAARAETPSLSKMATDSLEEGCLGEAVAAAEIKAAAWRADGPVAAHMHTIADDEARHARLSRHIARWAMGVGGAPVRRAMDEALALMPARSEPRPEPSGAQASAWGRADARAQAEAFARVRGQLDHTPVC